MSPSRHLVYYRGSMKQPTDSSSATVSSLRLQGGAVGLAREMRPLLVAMRPRQWVKNGLVLLALAFSVGQSWQLQEPDSWLPLLGRALVAFVCFCAVSSAEYLVNDLRDVERDRLHPRKRRRPIAARTLRPRTAWSAAVLLAAGGAALGSTLGPRFVLTLAGYGTLTLAYSLALKHMVILDILTLAVGFVMRAVAGALAISVPVSVWLYLCTLLGALFISIFKRRHEITLLEEGAAEHRPILAEYTTGLLDQMASVVTASTVVAYCLYTVTAENLPQNHAMIGTVPFVLYGIFRYMYLVHRHDAGGSPEEIFLKDRPLQVTGILWIITAMVILALSRG